MKHNNSDSQLAAALNKPGVMQGLQFEKLLQARLAELPYTKHLDGGQYNDGQAYGFECGARWAYEKLSGSPTVGSEGVGEANTCAGCNCGANFRMTKNGICVDCLKPVIRR